MIRADQHRTVRMLFQDAFDLFPHGLAIQAAIAPDIAQKEKEQRPEPKEVKVAPEFLDAKGYTMSGCEFHSRAFHKK